MSIKPKSQPLDQPATPQVDPDRAAYLDHCAGIEPLVRLALLGSPSQVRDRCRTKAQAKRVVRELIQRYDGAPGLDRITAAMAKPYEPADLALADRMAAEVGRYANWIRSVLPGPDAARIRQIGEGSAPCCVQGITECGFFAKREAIGLGVTRYAESQVAPARARADRMRSLPSPDEDGFGRQDGASLRARRKDQGAGEPTPEKQEPA